MGRKRNKRRRGGPYLNGNRYWADLRRYADVGGKQEPLIAHGEPLATIDPDVATKLYSDRVTFYEKRRRNRTLLGVAEEASLGTYASSHLVAKAQLRKHKLSSLKRETLALKRVLEYFGHDRDVGSITTAQVQAYMTARYAQKTRYGRPPADQTVLHELHALSDLFKRAVSEKLATANPVAALYDKPSTRDRPKRPWLTIDEGARLLAASDDAARHCTPFLRCLIATFLLTGGREQEVFGLQIEDLYFDGDGIGGPFVWFRGNRWRDIKRKQERRVPLWPQLAVMLRAELECSGRRSGLVFPSPYRRDGGPLTNIYDALKRCAALAGIEKHVTHHTFRHTYCAARLQTTECSPNGPVPVSLFTVKEEMGHASLKMIEEVYGHLDDLRFRSPVVEYLVQADWQARILAQKT